jgi:hypothetical protein
MHVLDSEIVAPNYRAGTMTRPKTTTLTAERSRKSVGIWIRVLTEDQVAGESPEHHEKALGTMLSRRAGSY